MDIILDECVFASDTLVIPPELLLPRPKRTDSRKEKQRRATQIYRENKKKAFETLSEAKSGLEWQNGELRHELETTKTELANAMTWGNAIQQELHKKGEELFACYSEIEKYKAEATKWKAELDQLRALSAEH